MKKTYSRILATLAIATTGMVMSGGSCSFGSNPDEGNNCWFICDRSNENSQTDPSLEGPLPASQAVSVKPA